MSKLAEPSENHGHSGIPPEAEDQWPEPPKLFTVTNGLLALGLLIFATAMSMAILASRQMKAEQTGAFWGEETASLIRSARPVELLRPDGSTAAKELEFYNEGWIDLSELRDLGYFRRVFLNDGSFLWDQMDGECPKASPSVWPWAYVRFGYQDEHSPGVTIGIHVENGQVGTSGGESTVPLTEDVRRRIAYRLKLFARRAADSE